MIRNITTNRISASAAPYIELLRPKQWIKNLFVLLPMFFGGQLFSASAWAAGAVATMAFVLASGAVYCLNDEIDREADARHPDKCRRPLAAGTVSLKAVRILMAACTALALGIPLPIGAPHSAQLQAVIGIYLAINVLYSLWLKNIAVLDALTVSAGFVLRVVAGGVACGIWLSPWIMLMTLMLALFLVVAKRRHELLLSVMQGTPARRSIRGCSPATLSRVLYIQAAVNTLLYICYTLQPAVRLRYHSDRVWLTALPVVAGTLRYLYIAVVRSQAGCPTRALLQDRLLQAVIAAWLLTFGLIAY